MKTMLLVNIILDRLPQPMSYADFLNNVSSVSKIKYYVN
jgi:hypothetical protein